MRRLSILAIGLALSVESSVRGHDIITTPITWNREISRIVYERCASCHQDGSQAFSLMTYTEARPWAVAIKDEVLSRRMPPWGAVKGFGDFRNDQALTPEQMEVIVSWVEGGVPEGEAKDLPAKPKPDHSADLHSLHVIPVTGEEYKLQKTVSLDGLLLKTVPDGATFQITAERPDSSIEPLLWVDHYHPKFAHPFLYRNPIDLPAGSVIHGFPPDATALLLTNAGGKISRVP